VIYGVYDVWRYEPLHYVECDYDEGHKQQVDASQSHNKCEEKRRQSDNDCQSSYQGKAKFP
jgi:hypothetical protein